MLANKQDAVRIDLSPSLTREAGLHDFLRQLRNAQVRGARESSQLPSDSGFSNVDFFADRYVDLHDKLSIKKMNQEPLSDSERAMLMALEAMLDEIESEQPGLNKETMDLVQRVLKTYGP